MRSLWVLARRYGFDVPIALLAIAGMLELAVGRGSPDAPRTTVWFNVPAIAIMVLPLFARRRFPLAAPAAYWLLAAALSFIDGRLVLSITSIFVIGMAAAFLLGNLRGARQARMGLGIVLGGEPFPLPPAIDPSAYRIVQEGLTNALKHARASHADVTLHYAPGELQLEVGDDGVGAAASDGLGHGLASIRERVKIYGGQMTAGAATGGGFVLRTHLPLSGDRP